MLAGLLLVHALACFTCQGSAPADMAAAAAAAGRPALDGTPTTVCALRAAHKRYACVCVWGGVRVYFAQETVLCVAPQPGPNCCPGA